MATKASRAAARLMMAPAVVLLLGWMLVPLIMTLWFSFRTYLPLRGGDQGWTGFDNYVRFLTSSSFWPAVQTTLIIVLGVLIITVGLGILLAVLLDQPMWGQGVVRILVIAPFFVMPTVSALVWKNIFMDPTNGLFAHLWRFVGAEPVAWLSEVPLTSIVMIVSWQWLPFATLILLTAIQSLDSEQLEAAEMDGTSRERVCWRITLPLLWPNLLVVVVLALIKGVQIFDEVFVLTGGGPGTATQFIVQYIYNAGFTEQVQNFGLASAASVVLGVVLFVLTMTQLAATRARDHG